MTIEVDLLKWVGIYEEPAGSYQADNTTQAQFAHFPYEEGTLQAVVGQEMLDPLKGKIRLDGHDEKILGVKSCTLALATMLASHGQDLDGDVTPVTNSTWALLRVLQAVMGGSVTTTNESAQTVVVATNTTTTVVDCTAGHPANRFQIGGVIGCEVTSGSTALELREIKSISGDEVTVKEAFSAAPVTGTAVRGGTTVYLTEDPATSLQAWIESREATDSLKLRGLQGGMSLTLPVGGRGQVAFSLAGAGWAREGSSAATVPTYVDCSPFALNPFQLHMPTIGATTLVEIAQAEASIEPQITYAPQRSGAATETVARMRRQPSRPVVSGSWLAPYEDDTWYTGWANKTDYAIFAQLGSVAGSCMLISCPTVQITEVVPAVTGEGIVGQRVSWEGRHDAELAAATEVGYSAMRIHFV
jgi:hypothetical protein